MKRQPMLSMLTLNSSRHAVAPQPAESAAVAADPAFGIEPKYQPVYRMLLRDASATGAPAAVRAAAGVPLAVKRRIRDAVARATNSIGVGHQRQQDESCFSFSQSGSCCSRGWCEIPLWQKSLRTLEGMYGSGVLSFFVFLKSLFALNIILSILLGLFVIAPQAAGSGQYSSMLASLMSSEKTNASGLCSEIYAANLSSVISSGASLARFLDVIQGTGILENTILFVGYYFPTALSIGALSYNMPVAYLAVTGAAFFISMLFMLERTGAAFKEVLLQRAQPSVSSKSTRFSPLILSAWDFGLSDSKTANLAKQLLRNNLVAELDLHRLLQRRLEAGRCGGCSLIAKRVLVNILVLGLLCGAGFAIYQAQKVSAEYTTAAGVDTSSFAYLAYQYLPMVIISLLVAILPILFQLLARLEEYTPDTELAVTLGRCIFLRLASLTVLVISIYSIITCDTKDTCGVGVAPRCSAVHCWEAYVGQAFYKLEITFFAVQLVVCFVVELPRSLIARKCQCKAAKLIGPPEFNISDSVLDVLYAQVIVWFGMLFCPFLPVMNSVVLFLLFYLRKFSCHFSYKPPDRPMKNSSATVFFMVTLFLAYFVCLLPIGYAIVSISTSKGCSPFRTGGTAYQPIKDVVAGFSSDGRHLIDYLSSASFLFVVIISLLIAIHYYRTLAIARKEIGDQRLKQLNEQEEIKFARIRSARLAEGGSGGGRGSGPSGVQADEANRPLVRRQHSGFDAAAVSGTEAV
uniref:TMC domain-containing protein n=2 Tax=Macrostomum lignano TaxID=282301 RepID=A0A1I8IPM2_9PLAT